MEKIIINTAYQRSVVLIGEKWSDVKKYLPGEGVVIITDDNVNRIYKDSFPDFPTICITPGEGSKRLEVIESLAKRLLDMGIDRSGFVLGIGGGVVCDIAGFLASIYMRGIRFGFISSSLLSQVDASVGGKNGVDLGAVKNILGNFRQPEFVICDPSMLLSLPEDEYLSGLAELIKNAVIRDADLLSEIEQNRVAIMKREKNILTRLITRSVDIKASVVRKDEKEAGKRMLLNFGHTFGHAIETQTGLKHGFAVAAGMIIAADISVKDGILHQHDRDRLFELFSNLKLIRKYEISSGQFEELILRDKKKSGDLINFVLLESIGKAIVRKLPVKDLIETFKSINY